MEYPEFVEYITKKNYRGLQKELCEALLYNKSTMSRVCSGRLKPSKKLMKLICDYLGE